MADGCKSCGEEWHPSVIKEGSGLCPFCEPKLKKPPKQFCIGDRCYYKSGSSWGSAGQKTLIHQASYCGDGVFNYSTSEGAWVDHNELALISRADEESFEQLDKEMAEEYDEGEE